VGCEHRPFSTSLSCRGTGLYSSAWQDLRVRTPPACVFSIPEDAITLIQSCLSFPGCFHVSSAGHMHHAEVGQGVRAAESRCPTQCAPTQAGGYKKAAGAIMETISEPYRLGADVICSRLLRARPASPLGRPLTLHLTVMGKGGLLVKGMWQLQFVSGTGGHPRQQRSGCVAYCWRSKESLDEHTYRAAGGQPPWGERSRGSGDVSCITTSPAFTLRVHPAVWPAQPLVPSLQSMPPPSASRHLKNRDLRLSWCYCTTTGGGLCSFLLVH